MVTLFYRYFFQYVEGEQLNSKTLSNLITQISQFQEDNLGYGNKSEATRIPVSLYILLSSSCYTLANVQNDMQIFFLFRQFALFDMLTSKFGPK